MFLILVTAYVLKEWHLTKLKAFVKPGAAANFGEKWKHRIYKKIKEPNYIMTAVAFETLGPCHGAKKQRNDVFLQKIWQRSIFIFWVDF